MEAVAALVASIIKEVVLVLEFKITVILEIEIALGGKDKLGNIWPSRSRWLPVGLYIGVLGGKVYYHWSQREKLASFPWTHLRLRPHKKLLRRTLPVLSAIKRGATWAAKSAHRNNMLPTILLTSTESSG